jgi:ABC-type glycerol-3-phosphate transport system substrate-binding protein
MTNRRMRFTRGLIVLLLLGLLFPNIINQIAVPSKAYASDATSAQESTVDDLNYADVIQSVPINKENNAAFEPYYLQVSYDWKASRVKDATQLIRILGSQVKSHSAEAEYNVGSYKGKDNVLLWTSRKSSWIEYEVNVPEEGLYELIFSYHPYTAEGERNIRPAVLALSLNGSFPFREARSIKFPRLFRDELPLKKDAYGDHIRPQSIEIEQWLNKPAIASDGAYALPMKWHFKQGLNTLRLQSNDQIVIDQIILAPPTSLETYEQAKSRYPEVKMQNKEVIRFEAEEVTSKNAVSIQIAGFKEGFMTPASNGNIIFNSYGGNRWRLGGEALSWNIEVPEAGLYKISMRTFQGYFSNKAIFRNIYINNKLPFKEMVAYRFPYSSQWEGTVLQDANGNPFEFYLEKGTHTLTLEATYGPYNEVIKSQEILSRAINDVQQELLALTGGVEDNNRTWKIERDFPEIPQKLQNIYDVMQQLANSLIKTNGIVDDNSQSILTAGEDIQKLLKYPDDIPYEINKLSIISNRIGQIQTNLVQAPLALDTIYVTPVTADFPRMEANVWEKIKSTTVNFFASFKAKTRLSSNDKDVLNIWMFMGRDYINMLQQMADQYFTPETGIKVRVDLVPNEELIVLANATGKAPDLVIGVGEGRPTEFAFRGAAQDLSGFEGYDKLVQQYAPGALLPYYYDGKYYAFPVTQSYKMLFYRKDILDRLGLDVPNTWEDVYRMLPTLQQNNYSFFVPPDFMTFIYQYGAEFYDNDGLNTGLDTPEGFNGFKKFTDLYSVYGIDRQVPSFYQHFRNGFMPIGIADFNTYLQLQVAAPELFGWWGMAPIPGVKNEQGVIERWSGGGQTATMMFKNSENKAEGWEFMQWWLSPEIQESFGTNLEGFYGVQFRWNTANIEAISRLPWSDDELKVLYEQWRWYKDLANIPGSYFIPREMNNAWNRSVIDGMNYRTSLEEAIMNINRELQRKSVEFGFRDKEGNMLKSYNPPLITKPWEGVEQFGR